MKPESGPTPVVCRLSSAELREREAALLSQFSGAVIDTEELADGYAFRLSGEATWLRLVADLIAAERECCPFLTFEVLAQPNMGPITVRMTGPSGTKEFLRNICGISKRPLGANG